MTKKEFIQRCKDGDNVHITIYGRGRKGINAIFYDYNLGNDKPTGFRYFAYGRLKSHVIDSMYKALFTDDKRPYYDIDHNGGVETARVVDLGEDGRIKIPFQLSVLDRLAYKCLLRDQEASRA